MAALKRSAPASALEEAVAQATILREREGALGRHVPGSEAWLAEYATWIARVRNAQGHHPTDPEWWAETYHTHIREWMRVATTKTAGVALATTWLKHADQWVADAFQETPFSWDALVGARHVDAVYCLTNLVPLMVANVEQGLRKMAKAKWVDGMAPLVTSLLNPVERMHAFHLVLCGEVDTYALPYLTKDEREQFLGSLIDVHPDELKDAVAVLLQAAGPMELAILQDLQDAGVLTDLLGDDGYAAFLWVHAGSDAAQAWLTAAGVPNPDGPMSTFPPAAGFGWGVRPAGDGDNEDVSLLPPEWYATPTPQLHTAAAAAGSKLVRTQSLTPSAPPRSSGLPSIRPAADRAHVPHVPAARTTRQHLDWLTFLVSKYADVYGTAHAAMVRQFVEGLHTACEDSLLLPHECREIQTVMRHMFGDTRADIVHNLNHYLRREQPSIPKAFRHLLLPEP